MAPQSQVPHAQVPHAKIPNVLLTRPLAQSRRFARGLRVAFGEQLHIAISPLMEVAFAAPELPLRTPAGLIFSSESGVAAYARLANRPTAPAWCVGQRTAKAAKNWGLIPVLTAKDAADLLSQMIAMRPSGQLLHLRGQDSHGDIALTLTSVGIPTLEAIVYAQTPQPLSQRAKRLLQGAQPVTVPLFSARSARLFCAASPLSASLRFAALSPAVAEAISADLGARVRISPSPDGKAMLQTVIALLREPSSA